MTPAEAIQILSIVFLAGAGWARIAMLKTELKEYKAFKDTVTETMHELKTEIKLLQSQFQNLINEKEKKH